MKAWERQQRQQEALSGSEPDQGARVVDAGPLRWAWGPGAWERAGGWALELGGSALLIGEARWLRAWRKPLTQAFLEQGVDTRLHALPDGAECCEEMARALAAEVAERACIVTLGGGRLMDLGKWAGDLAVKPVITLPSSAATCACASSVVVVNSSQGEYLDVLSLDGPPYGCAVDEALIASAPPRLLAAGLADSLAKSLEWEAVGIDLAQPGATAGWQLAQGLAQNLREQGRQAVQGDRDALRRCISLCLLDSALVSGLGGAPAAAAHSLANALSADPVAKQLLHGEAVGLGLLFQERLLGRDGSALRDLLEAWGLPTQLRQGSLADQAAVLSKLRNPEETLWLLPDVAQLTAPRLEEGLHSLLDGSNIEL